MSLISLPSMDSSVQPERPSFCAGVPFCTPVTFTAMGQRPPFVHFFCAGRRAAPAIKNEGKDVHPSLSVFGKLLGFRFHDFLALVVAAVAAYLMGKFILTALRALRQRGRGQLPHRGATFIASCLGNLSLGYCHCKHLLMRDSFRQQLLQYSKPFI